MDSVPRQVTVVGNPAEQGLAKGLFAMFRERYRTLRDSCGENETLAMEYHTAAGERIALLRVAYPSDTDMLVLEGLDYEGHLCQVLAKAHVVQVLFRFVPLTDPEAKRKPIGFVVE